MTLVKTKHKVTANQRKMTALHHRRSSKYVKPYLPYLPLFLIIGGSLIAGQFLPHNSFSSLGTTDYSARVQSVAGSKSALLLDLTYLVLIALVVWFIVRHYKRIRSIIIRGEQLLMRHYLFDTLLALMIGWLYILVS